jgi:hypothetical protein
MNKGAFTTTSGTKLHRSRVVNMISRNSRWRQFTNKHIQVERLSKLMTHVEWPSKVPVCQCAAAVLSISPDPRKDAVD